MTKRHIGLTLVACLMAWQSAWAESVVSYPPLRPLPVASQRPLEAKQARFVDPQKGDDAHAGTLEAPWRTLTHAATELAAGQTLCLRGGIYWEHVALSLKGTAEAPITIRSYPGELVVLDGGFRDFLEDPAHAWEPAPQGAKDEYQSTKAYASVDVGGSFADSMVPLRLYGSFVDMRASKEYEDKKLNAKEGVYVGPGIKRDDATGRIHVRLSHTTLEALGDENYQGQTDPRKMPLVIASDKTVLKIKGAEHFVLQDVVIRGSSTAVTVSDSQDVRFDGVTLYVVRYGLVVADTRGFKVFNSAFRGFDAPWHPRESGTDVDCFCPLAQVELASGGDFEFAYNEFTDHHDCFHISEVDSVDFHHNFVDHFNDDCLDVNLHKHMGTYRIHDNHISRALTAISIHGSVAIDPSDSRGLYLYRNVFDLRDGTYKRPPVSLEEKKYADFDKGFFMLGRLAADHGSPIWPPIYFYHNTVLQRGPTSRGAYAGGLGVWGLKQTKRCVFDNLFVHNRMFDAKGVAFVLPPKPAETDMQVDGNLFWGLEDGAGAPADLLAKWRQSSKFEESKKLYAAGWTAHDLWADPKLQALTTDLKKPTDLTLQQDSPAINAGVPISASWPDSLREQGKDLPDIGAIPFGVKPPAIGIQGRLSMFPQGIGAQ